MEVYKLNKSIDNYSPGLNQKSRETFAKLCSEKTIKSKDRFMKPNLPDQSEYILLEGIARTYLLNAEGEEITISFFEENEILPPHVTRTENGRSLFYCEALTDCLFAEIDAKSFENLMIEDLKIRDFGNNVLRQELLKKVRKEIMMASWTAKERLDQFRKDYNMLENRIPHPAIASYIGITNVSLSRLRKQL